MPTSPKALAARLDGCPTADQPWLVWLHGLFGSGDDWQTVLPFFADFPCLVIDLPGHGASADIAVADMAAVSRLLTATLQQHGVHRYWLIGYSMGGRLAAYHATYGGADGRPPPGLCGLLVEGAHPGLPEATEREERLRHDRTWAERLRCEALPQVLADWYRQPVFAALSAAQRAAMQHRRSRNDAAGVAMMLMACSLAQQPWLGDRLATLALPFAFLCGADDGKFQHLARACGFPLHLIGDAGHNAHAANPLAFAATIHELLNGRK